MRLTLVRLRFESPVRVGNEDLIDAITLFRALMSSLAQLGEDLSELFEGVRLSALYPVINGVPYLKAPVRRVKCDRDRREEKEAKSREFIALPKLVEVLKLRPPAAVECSGEGYVWEDGQKRVEVKKEGETAKLGDFAERVVVYRNRIDRATGAADPFSFPAVVYKAEMGFLAQGWSKKLGRALKLLSETGIGGDRNLGYGRFKVVDEKEIEVGDFRSEYRYLTARGWAEGDFMAERLDNVTIYAGGNISMGVYMLTLLPAGSLAKDVKPLVLRGDNQAVVVNPVTIPT